MSPILRLASLLICIALAGCLWRPRAVVVKPKPAPVATRPVRTEVAPPRREYVVARGDTLYGIAFRNGVDFRELARLNGISSPYTIYPGQRLKLQATTPASSRVATNAASNTSRASAGLPNAPLTAPTPSPPPTQPVAAPTPPPTTSTTSPKPPAVAAIAPQPLTWRWPASGQIVSRYVSGDPTRQGLNIAGNGGQPVFAAAPGEVVYSGAGLIGYGELVIIKHSDEFLSAYGHNRKRLVAEGQRVTAGQQIAEMGRSGAARDMLHFEIRKNGKPIDPVPLLPKK